MNRFARLRPLRTAVVIMMLTPFAAFAQSGPQHDRHDRPATQWHETPQRDARGPQTRRDAFSERRHADTPQYRFRAQDRAQLQRHYRKSLQKIDREHRPRFEAGRSIPRAYRSYITPAPVIVRSHLPRPPAGYRIGYYQGYSVVYEPTTFVILSVLDLLTR